MGGERVGHQHGIFMPRLSTPIQPPYKGEGEKRQHLSSYQDL